MNYRLNIKDLSNPQELNKLLTAITEIAEQCDVLYTTTAPNGTISGRQGRICLYNNSGTYETWQNTDGGTTWQRIDQGAVETAFSGEIKMYGGSSAPTGWLACDGSAVSRTTYADLFAVIGETYGVGDGSTTFNLPNFTNKMPRGNTPGTGGGSDTHTHGVGSYAFPNHSHAAGTLAGPSHNHQWYNYINTTTSAHTYASDGTTQALSITTFSDSYAILSNINQATSLNVDGYTTKAGTGAVTGSTASDAGAAITGTSASGDNVPAYTAVMFIIKV